jgi:hypothetical protein
MALNITTGTATNIGLCRAILIQVNTALTGTIIIATGGSTQYGTQAQTIGTVTNPTVGQEYMYGGLHGQGAVTITPSTTCDISVTKINKVI